MKIGICSAVLTDMELPKDISYIGVDRGVEKLLAQGITPAFAIGDFDSISDPHVLEAMKNVEILPERKDVTDTHAAVDWAYKNGYDEIYIYGATGARLDHFIAVLKLLELYRDINIFIVDRQNKLTLLRPGTYNIYPEGYKYFSFYALDRAVITITGAEYERTDYELLRNDPLATSNQVKGEYATLKTDGDLILVRAKDM